MVVEETAIAAQPIVHIPGETVLVTGGCGFIGSHTARTLLRQGYRVIVVDEMNDYYDPNIKHANLRDLRHLSKVVSSEHIAAAGSDQVPVMTEWERFVFYKVDIGDMAALRKVYEQERPTLVCHLAARAGVRYSIEDPAVYAHSNVLGTTNILELSHQFKVRSVAMASSSSVYGDRPSEEQKSWKDEHADEGTENIGGADMEDEETPGAFRETDVVTKPASPYAATKRACELLAYTYTRLHNMPIACLRFFTVYGPGGRPDMAPFKFIKRIYNGVSIDRYGDGSAVRDFTYVTDIVDGILLSLLKPQGFQIYNLGGGRPISLAHFIVLCELAVGKRAIINVLPTQPGDVARTHASIIKAKRQLGFRAKVEVADGLKRTAEWYIKFQKATEEKAAEDGTVEAEATTEQPSEDALRKAEAAQQSIDEKAASVAVPKVVHGNLVPSLSSASSDNDSGFPGTTSGKQAMVLDSAVCSAASDDSESTVSTDAVAPEINMLVCTRIHSMQKLGSHRRDQLTKFVQSVLSHTARSVGVCVAVQVVPERAANGGFDLYNEVNEVTALAVEDLASKRGWSRHELKTVRAKVFVQPVSPWGITRALNECVHKATDACAEHLLFASLEVDFNVNTVETLVRECDTNDTLVAGLALNGHESEASVGQPECVVDGTGTTVPWNTLAVWNTLRLSQIGFVAIGNGNNMTKSAAGIEEVSTIAVIQQLRAQNGDAKAKLISATSSKDIPRWDVSYGDNDVDAKLRRAKHILKMENKKSRAVQHMEQLAIPSPSVIHRHVTMEA